MSMIHRKENDSNEELLNRDMTHATREDIIFWLIQIIDNEVSQPANKVNADLLQECSAFLDELSSEEDAWVEESRQRVLTQIGSYARSTVQSTPSNKKFGHKILWRMLFPLAATFMLLFLSLTVVALAKGGYREAWVFIEDNIKLIQKLKPGEKIEEDGFTIIKGGEFEIYNDFEEFKEQEKLEIIYPGVLPEGYKMTGVDITFEDESKGLFIITFLIEPDDLFITVRNYLRSDPTQYVGYDTYTVNAVSFFIIQMHDGKYQAIMQCNSYEYVIVAPSYEKLIYIIDHMKGL